jgi:hypothetical protein
MTNTEAFAPINNRLVINDLDSGRMYRFQFALQNRTETHTQTIDVSTKLSSQFFLQNLKYVQEYL